MSPTRRCIDCAFCAMPKSGALLDARCTRSLGLCLQQRYDNQHGNRSDRCGVSARYFRARSEERA